MFLKNHLSCLCQIGSLPSWWTYFHPSLSLVFFFLRGGGGATEMKSAGHQYLFIIHSNVFYLFFLLYPGPSPHFAKIDITKTRRLWNLAPPFQILRFEIGLDLQIFKLQEMEPVGSSAMMIIMYLALVLDNIQSVDSMFSMLIPKSTLWLSFSKPWLSWTHRQELS